MERVSFAFWNLLRGGTERFGYLRALRVRLSLTNLIPAIASFFKIPTAISAISQRSIYIYSIYGGTGGCENIELNIHISLFATICSTLLPGISTWKPLITQCGCGALSTSNPTFFRPLSPVVIFFQEMTATNIALIWLPLILSSILTLLDWDCFHLCQE
jgi:hypothetical protein